MAHATAQADLFPRPEGVVVVNDRCVVRADGDQRAVVLAGLVLWHFAAVDRMAEAHAMVSLVEQGWADQNDVARAFGYSARTVRRLQRRYEQGGLVELRRVAGYPKGRPRLPSRDRWLGKLKGAGLSNRAIAHKLGVSEKAVRKRLHRLGWTAVPPEQVSLPMATPSPPGADPNLSASAGTSTAGADQSVFSGAPVELEPIATTFDRDPMDRRLDRLFAYLGLLDDAAPLFQAGTMVPAAGVLMALPSLIHSGIFALARKTYGSIGPAFYGLRTTILTLLLMALLRIKRPEALKEHSPPELGRVLGLDRAPEVKTLRRKLTRLAGLGVADRLGRLLAERRVAVRGQTLGFLYVDGHVRVYHGQRDLPKAHVARMRLALPATTDYWVNDEEGDPLFVLTAEANAGMVKMLPQILHELRRLVGERRLTIVFDRGGFSPRLFDQLIREGFDILTYRKGRFPKLPMRCFKEHVGRFGGGEVRYQLDDRGVQLLGRKLRLRQVTRLKDGHQTPILTSRRDLTALEIAHRMFDRWRQENFFKYMREEYLLDALVDYQVEPDDPNREVPNPARRAIDAEVQTLRAEIARLQQEYGEAAIANPEHHRPTMRGFKIAHGRIGKTLRATMKRLTTLERRRARVPPRIPVGERTEGPVIKLATQRKHLTSLLKMVAYQAESDLCRLLAPNYKRHFDEGRTLIQTALASAADIEVSAAELCITLAPLSSPHRSRAIAAVCRDLDATETVFPGTRLRLRYRVAGPGRIQKADI
jgi:transposase